MHFLSNEAQSNTSQNGRLKCRGGHWSPVRWRRDSLCVGGFSFSACGEITTKSWLESVACDGLESPQVYGITQRVYESGALDDPYGSSPLAEKSRRSRGWNPSLATAWNHRRCMESP